MVVSVAGHNLDNVSLAIRERDVHTDLLSGCGVESASQSRIWWLFSGTIWTAE
jgi:hypothetical protein